MELASKYNPSEVEDKWYQYWLKNGFFKSKPDGRKPYTVVIPPPNVTGVLHMGHMLNNTIQDILVRRARMQGFNACWVPGTDHASIATEAKVVNKLASEGIKKKDLTREQFLEHAWDWTRKHGGIILEQLKKLGASCDWDRTAFTMDDKRSESVLKVFVDLYEKGLIYRGLRMVNWDPKAQTVLSTEEVIYRDEKSKLFYLKYYVHDSEAVKLTGEEGEVFHKDVKGYYAVVATTRPETIMGDTAMCINPKDPKNQWLKGHKVIVPLVGRVIPVIEDRYVDVEFGTGCLKVTPAHDVNDYALGKTHGLETIDIFNADGTISEAAGMYVGQDRFDVRKQIAIDLDNAGLLEKVEDYNNKVGYSERNQDTAVEPRLCKQWFLSMQHFADIALPPVVNGELKFYPSKYVTTYKNWLENIQDWCISRQLWWGHRIPAYFLPTEEGAEEKFVVALTVEDALAKAKKIAGYENITADQLVRDEDALDTWFSSWLWPISLFDGINNPGNEEINYYYPTSDLVTGPDIIFFWVARMIMAGYEYQGKMPFRNVYFTGIVRDKIGRKMSKSLGNSPDPLDLIATYGADGVRMGMMLSAPAGNDILFDDALCEQGRNFNNKIWNAFRLVKGWDIDDKLAQPETAKLAIKWFGEQLNKTIIEIDDCFSKYRLSEALMAVYKLFRDEFSAWYLEMVKPEYQHPIDAATLNATLGFFEALLKLLHPFMPFITEELYQAISDRDETDSIMVAQQPKATSFDESVISKMEVTKELIAGVRNLRAEKGISPRKEFDLFYNGNLDCSNNALIQKLANITSIKASENNIEGATASFMVGTVECIVPLGDTIDIEAEVKKIEADIKYYEGFLVSVEKKLGNEKFVSHAKPEIVEIERKKKADAELKLATLKANLAALKK
ncbi:MAG: valine--tRNA ligase [Paludibacteraceae bacterium]|nr:valine--tRNA ligase [Paludibacteraceae bacterium]